MNGSDGILAGVLRQYGPDLDPKLAWTQEQWCEAFSFLFVGDRDDRHPLLEHQDDLLWFVAGTSAPGPGAPRITLRRNTAPHQLPDELRPGGTDFASVDWRLSVSLNLVVQAKYILTVVQCRQDALATVAQDYASTQYRWHNSHKPQLVDTVVTRRRVYGSPMAADVNLEGAKSGQPPKPCYPDVCFAVDNFEDAFEDMMLSRPGDCYCVLLHVHSSHDGSTASNHKCAPTPPPGPCGAPQGPPERRSTLFSAYVTREQVADYIAAHSARTSRPSLLHWLLGAPRQPDRSAGGPRERIIMNGPGGIGRAEAMATALPAAKDANSHAKPGLKLSLMWMSLPVEALAQCVLRFACSL